MAPISATSAPSITSAPFGILPDGRVVDEFTLSAGVFELRVLTYGAIVTSLLAPDRDGRRDNVVLGYDGLQQYLADSAYLGAVVGRYANRIDQAAFEIDGRRYQLTANDGRHHLHGGQRGFNRHLWTAAASASTAAASLQLRHVSPAGTEGYPGTLTAEVRYSLTASGSVYIDYTATTDATTIVNLSQHSYFNLSGGAQLTILDHELSIAAARFTPVHEGLIPIGTVIDVASTPFDFRSPVTIRRALATSHPQLAIAGGFDHNWILEREAPSTTAHAARLSESDSGRTLHVDTTEPGLQFYDGHFLGRSPVEHRFTSRAGLCLETQHYPNSPNTPHFPSTILRPGEQYRSSTVWRFTVE